MSFEDSFVSWLRSSLNSGLPATVRAFSFNLFELGSDDSPFGVELIGSADFDTDDGDWACEEVWEGTPRRLEIPSAFSTSSWEACLANMKALVLRTLQDETVGQALRCSQGVALGFVDGDLDVVWHR